MSTDRSWIFSSRLGPIASAAQVARIGVAMAPSIVIGHHVILPIDAHGWSDRMIVIGGDPASWVTCIEDSLQTSRHGFLVFLSRRHHDIVDESDGTMVVMVGSWLASSGIEVRDWFLTTPRSARSVPADLHLPRTW